MSPVAHWIVRSAQGELRVSAETRATVTDALAGRTAPLPVRYKDTGSQAPDGRDGGHTPAPPERPPH